MYLNCYFFKFIEFHIISDHKYFFFLVVRVYLLTEHDRFIFRCDAQSLLVQNFSVHATSEQHYCFIQTVILIKCCVLQLITNAWHCWQTYSCQKTGQWAICSTYSKNNHFGTKKCIMIIVSYFCTVILVLYEYKVVQLTDLIRVIYILKEAFSPFTTGVKLLICFRYSDTMVRSGH